MNIKVKMVCEICKKEFSRWPCELATAKYCSKKCFFKSKQSDIRERFFDKVEKTDTCWLWKGIMFPSGYGAFYFKNNNRRASRVSYILHFGKIAEKMFVCHRCDNPKCVNPDHLFIGTPKDNSVDAKNKGRMAKGRNNGAFTKPHKDIIKLNVESVKLMRQLDKEMTRKELCKKFNVNETTISNVITRKTWKHVA